MTLKLLYIFEKLVNYFLFSEYNLEYDFVSDEPPVQHGPELPSAYELLLILSKSQEEVQELNKKLEISRFGFQQTKRS